MFEQLVNPVIEHGMEIIMALLDAGADIKAHNPEGFTPLMVAALDTENPDIIITILDAGADGKARDEDDKTAFDWTQKNKHLKGTDAYSRLNDAQF